MLNGEKSKDAKINASEILSKEAARVKAIAAESKVNQERAEALAETCRGRNWHKRLLKLS